jgi:DNA-binding GntR family transcriptional regulator
MGALEALAGKLALRRITGPDIEKLTRLREKMLSCFRRRDGKNYIKANREIHEAIFEIASNGTLISIYHQPLGRIHVVRFLAPKTPLQWEQASRITNKSWTH